jgi:hypothetical protein
MILDDAHWCAGTGVNSRLRNYSFSAEQTQYPAVNQANHALVAVVRVFSVRSVFFWYICGMNIFQYNRNNWRWTFGRHHAFVAVSSLVRAILLLAGVVGIAAAARDTAFNPASAQSSSVFAKSTVYALRVVQSSQFVHYSATQAFVGAVVGLLEEPLNTHFAAPAFVKPVFVDESDDADEDATQDYQHFTRNPHHAIKTSRQGKYHLLVVHSIPFYILCKQLKTFIV